ncbi:hypothetical protein O181_057311 [Austropuccinia psidii MF-1]|uniref:Uncharacterized protein n=1 Tax=Austropuccinia psidii MF-1 TaxID=1389203 RepID=A0A9Q3EEY7_9BASI|nr:hypothetical protein [Austropuccinia psidii MF-1]
MVNIQDPFGAELITQDLPCNFGEARILIVLDPLNGSRPGANLWSHGTPGSRGPPIAPTDCGLRRTARGPWDTSTAKWPKMAIYQIFTPRTKKGLNGHKITFIKEAP